jgi:signal transduction histidine kinase
MLEEAQRLTELTEALLTLSRTESGHAQVHVESLNVAEVVRDVTQNLGILATDKDQELQVNGESEMVAKSDRTLLRQALLNIVHNAIRYSPTRSHITLKMRRTEHEAIVEVVDQGPGIGTAHRARVFDRFFDTGRSRSEGGYGLGLAIAKASIERCGGRIEVDSEPGSGSTFRIHLPASSLNEHSVTRASR